MRVKNDGNLTHMPYIGRPNPVRVGVRHQRAPSPILTIKYDQTALIPFSLVKSEPLI